MTLAMPRPKWGREAIVRAARELARSEHLRWDPRLERMGTRELADLLLVRTGRYVRGHVAEYELDASRLRSALAPARDYERVERLAASRPQGHRWVPRNAPVAQPDRALAS